MNEIHATHVRKGDSEFRRWLLSLPDQIAVVNNLTKHGVTCPDPGTEHGRALLETLGVKIVEPQR